MSLGVPMKDHTRRVWRRVAAAGPTGAALATLREQLAGQVDDEPLHNALRSLKRGGYVRWTGGDAGVRRGSERWIAEKTPEGEQVPAWQVDQHEADDAAPGAPATVAMPPAPASVFHLPQLMQAGAKPLACASAAEPDRAAPAALGVGVMPATVRAAAPASFALSSTGVLAITAAGQTLLLGHEDTRSLFRWLDRLAGTHLGHLLEGATS